MIMAFILIFCVIIAALLAVLVFLLLRAAEKVNNAEQQFREFVSPGKDNQPSPLSQFIALESKMLAQDFTNQIKTSMLGKASGAARQENAIAGDIVSDVLNETNPMLGMILDQFPTLKKRIVKNPQMAFGAMNLLSGLGKGPGNNGHFESSGNSDSYRESK
jgi:hypothetical protein